MIPEDILSEKAKNAPNKTKEIEKHGNQRKFSLYSMWIYIQFLKFSNNKNFW